MDIRRIEISSIQESTYNPRVKLKKGSREYEQIAESIHEFGFVEPLVVNMQNMRCIGGHQRLQVLKDLGETKVECVMVDIPEEEREKALCVALNKISGDWDMEKLAFLLENEEVNIFPTGFLDGDVDLEKYLVPDESQEDEIEMDAETAPEADSMEEEDNSATRVKIGGFQFSVKAADYYALINDIRDNGIFEPGEVREELQRRILNG